MAINVQTPTGQLIGRTDISSSSFTLEINAPGATNNYIHLTNGTTGTTAGDGAQIGISSGTGLLEIIQVENQNIRILQNTNKQIVLENNTTSNNFITKLKNVTEDSDTYLGVIATPEASIVADPGDLYIRADNGSNVGSLWIKGSGVATNTGWTQLSGGGSSGWLLAGNTGTTPPADFLGTTDTVDLLIQTNSGAGGLAGGGAIYLGSNATTAQEIFIGDSVSGSDLTIRIGDGATSATANISIGGGKLGTSQNINIGTGSNTGQAINIGTTAASSSDVTIGTTTISDLLFNYRDLSAGQGLTFDNGTVDFVIHADVASPEGVITGTRGDLAVVDDGATGSLYVKTTGSATNTGWLPILTQSKSYFDASILSVAGLTSFYRLNVQSGASTATEDRSQSNNFAGTFDSLRVNVFTNTATAATTLEFRVNGASAGPTITIPALTTGSFSDSTAVTVAAGDLTCYRIVAGAVGAVSMTAQLRFLS